MDPKLPEAKGNGPAVIFGSTWNRLVQYVRWLSRIRAIAPIVISESPAGRTISIASLPRVQRMKVTELAGEDDDDQALVKAQHWDGTTASGDPVYLVTIKTHLVDDDLLATQPAGGTWDEAGGDTVVDPDGNPVTWMEVGGDSRPAILAKIVSVISSAGGKYNGTIYGGAMADDGTGNLALPDGMTAGDDCLVVNEDEDSQPTHWIKPDTYAEGFYGGMSTEDTPRPIIRLLRAQYLADGANTLATGTSETAYPDTWDRTRVTSGTDYGESVQVPRVTRLIYNSAGDQVLYQFIQTDTIAADGRRVSTTAEVRSAVDTPDADCTDDPGSNPDYSRSFMSF